VLGENDVHVILDLPENLIAAAISLAVMSKGATISLPFWITMALMPPTTWPNASCAQR
jgi:hypothetical protein